MAGSVDKSHYIGMVEGHPVKNYSAPGMIKRIILVMKVSVLLLMASQSPMRPII